MYKLLLVDDESDIREGLMEVVPFRDLGFTVAGQAASGLEALPLCETLQPDLIITDIRMPLMDGLTMCREILKKQPTAHFIILSGYDDFEYARQAMAFKSLSYLLKPISAPEFMEALREARRKLDEEYAQKRDVERLRLHYLESLPLLREMLLSSLLSGGIDAQTALREAQRYELVLEAPQYAVAAVRVTGVETEEDGGLDDPELCKFAVMNIAREVLAPKCTAHVFHFDGMIALLLLLKGKGEGEFAQAQEQLAEVRRTAEHFLHVRLAMGLGAPCFELRDVSVCARQAASALDQNTLWGGEELLCITDVEPGASKEPAVSESDLRRLSTALKTGDREQTMETLAALMREAVSPEATLQGYRACILEILLALLRTARDMGVDTDLLDGGSGSVLSRLMRDPEPEQVFALLRDQAQHLLGSIREGRAGASASIVQQADDYLAAHFGEEDMSADRLCRALHVSVSYFGAVYRREKEETFHQALTRLRMDKAMTLLTSTDMKTAQVAAEVGLPDPSYFSYAFKRHFGFSPSQARSRKDGRP